MALGMPSLPDKAYFGMGEACKIAQVPPHTLRYWEANFSSLRPTRLGGGHRRYTRADLETVFSIKELLEGRRMTIAGAKKALLLRKKGMRPLESADGGGASALKLLLEVRKEIRFLVEELSK